MLDSKIHNYVANQKRLLELELRSQEEEGEEERNAIKPSSASKPTSNNNEEEEENNRRSNYILKNLQIDEWSVGLMGRTVVTFSCMTGELKSTKNNDTGAVDGRGKESHLNHDDKKDKNGDEGHLLLPAHRLTVGDEVEIMSKYNTPQNDGNGMNKKEGGSNFHRKRKKSGGVISAITDTMISIALFGNSSNVNQANNNTPSSNVSAKNGKNSKKKESSNNQDLIDESQTSILGSSPPFIIVPKSSIDVHRKMMDALDKLEKEGGNHSYAGKIIQQFFTPDAPAESMKKSDNDDKDEKDIVEEDDGLDEDESCSRVMEFTPFNANLDESQIEAIKYCLRSSKPISLIHGPPGTGTFLCLEVA